MPSQFANKKVQPKAREATLRTVEQGVYLVYHDSQGHRRSNQETKEWCDELINGFRLYCALYFYFNSGAASSITEIDELASDETTDYVYMLANYAHGIRDPIAYFFADHDSGPGLMAVFADGAARDIDFTTGYFSS